MSLSREELVKLARLARLSLNEAEIVDLCKNLTRIVDFVGQLNEVNVDKVEPMYHAGDRALTLREDVAKLALGRAAIKSSAGYEDGLIRVPKIID